MPNTALPPRPRPSACLLSPAPPAGLSDNLSSLDALLKALKDLDDLCVAIGDAYDHSLKHDHYERWDEKS